MDFDELLEEGLRSIGRLTDMETIAGKLEKLFPGRLNIEDAGNNKLLVKKLKSKREHNLRKSRSVLIQKIDGKFMVNRSWLLRPKKTDSIDEVVDIIGMWLRVNPKLVQKSNIINMPYRNGSTLAAGYDDDRNCIIENLEC